MELTETDRNKNSCTGDEHGVVTDVVQTELTNNNNNLLIGCSITRVVYIEVLITRCILYNTIKI